MNSKNQITSQYDEVVNIYLNLSEEMKDIISSELMHYAPDIYKRWYRRDKKLKTYHKPPTRKNAKHIGRCLDRCFEKYPQFASKVICCFFVTSKTGSQINSYFIDEISSDSKNKDTSAKAEELIIEITEKFEPAYPGIPLLFDKTIRLESPKWFTKLEQNCITDNKDECVSYENQDMVLQDLEPNPVQEQIFQATPSHSSTKKTIDNSVNQSCVKSIIDDKKVSSNKAISTTEKQHCFMTIELVKEINNSINKLNEKANYIKIVIDDSLGKVLYDERDNLLTLLQKAGRDVLSATEDYVSTFLPIVNIYNDNACPYIEQCNACSQLHHIFDIDSKTIGDIIQSSQQVNKLIETVEKNISIIDKTSHQLQSYIYQIEDDLGLQHTIESTCFNKLFFYGLHECRSYLGNEYKKLKAKQNQQLEENINLIQQILKDYEEIPEILDIQENISTVSTVKESKELLEQVDNLIVNIESFNPSHLAEKVIKSDYSIASIMNLISCLVNREQFTSALIFSYLFQQSNRDVMLIHNNTNMTIDDILIQVVRIVRFSINDSDLSWCRMLSYQPWMISFKTSEFDSPLMCGCLSLIWARAFQAFPKDDYIATMFHKYYEFSIATFHNSKNITNYLIQVRDQRAIRYSSSDIDIQLEEATEKLIDAFKKTRGHYQQITTKKANHIAQIECNVILPHLNSCWKKIRQLCSKKLFDDAKKISSFDSNDIYKSGNIKHDHDFYTPKLIHRISELKQFFTDYIDISIEQSSIGSGEVNTNDILSELKKSIEREPKLVFLYNSIKELFAVDISHFNTISDSQEFYDIEAVLISFARDNKESIRNFYPFITYMQNNTDSNKVNYTELLHKCCNCFTGECIETDILHALEKNSCFYELFLYDEKRKIDFNIFSQQLDEFIEDLRSANSFELIKSQVDKARHSKLYAKAYVIIKEKWDELQQNIKKDAGQIEQQITCLLSDLSKIEIPSCNLEWYERVLENCVKLRVQLMKLQKMIQSDFTNTYKEKFNDLNQAYNAILFITENNLDDFFELESILSKNSVCNNLLPKDDIETHLDTLKLDDENKSLRRDIVSYWQGMQENNIDNTRRAWPSFISDFCKLIGAVSTLGKTGSSITSVDELRIESRTSRFKYADSSEFFQMQICFHLLPGDRPLSNEIRALKVFLELTQEKFHVVFVTGNTERVKESLCGIAKNLVIVDSFFLDDILKEPQPENIIRMEFLRNESLADISPFTSHGRVLLGRHIYVGRENALQGITRRDASWICGGRRIGKTSLLHRLKSRLEKGQQDWRVIIVDASGKDDYKLCKQIIHELGWEYNKDDSSCIDFFTTRLRKELKENHIAILLDEVDGYIKISRESNLPTTFPLARAFRSIAQTDDDKGHFKIVYAGFKELFKEAEGSDVKIDDRNFPFRQFMTRVKLDPLTAAETKELIHIGFTKIFGFSYSEDIPRIIFNHTGGHPAFVQELCTRILGNIENLRSLGAFRQSKITKIDVEKVFNNESIIDGNSSFIDFVDKTLKLNFLPLDRAIFLHIADVSKSNLMESYFSKDMIIEKMEEYHRIAVDIQDADTIHFEDDIKHSLDMLVMTGMLNVNPKGYVIAIRPYVKILVRLNQIEKDIIFRLLEEYTKKII